MRLKRRKFAKLFIVCEGLRQFDDFWTTCNKNGYNTIKLGT